MLRALGFAVVILMLLFASLLVFATVQGRIGWLVWPPSCVTVEGTSNGYVHTCAARSFLIVTRIDGKQRQSYRIGLKEPHFLIHCGDWVARAYQCLRWVETSTHRVPGSPTHGK